MRPPLPTAHTSLADTALKPCRVPPTGSEAVLHLLPFQCSMTAGFPLPTAARAHTSAGEIAAMERIRPLLAVPVVSIAPGETLHCVPFQCSIRGVTPELCGSLTFMAEPPAHASVGLSALTAFSWPSGGSLAGEATWLQDWPFQCSMKLVLEFCPTAQMSLGPDPETPLSEDAEALAGAPGTTLQVEPFHSSIKVSKPLPLAATRVWPTAQAWVWEAAKAAFSWENVLPAGLGLLSTCHVPAASAGDAAISAAATPPATVISARRIFTNSPLLALAVLCVGEPDIGSHEPHVVDCSNI